MAELPAFQKVVARFVNARRIETSVEVRTLDLVSEVGELAKEVLVGTDYGAESFAPTGEWVGELGDAFFSLICVANTSGVNLEAALGQALARYESRIARRGDPGSGRGEPGGER